jgi:predicted ATP-grasp superfamily ATP-dependent carboligase
MPLNINVLVFPCGSEIGLEIHNALKFVKNITLYGASSVDDHGKFVYRNYIPEIPNVDEDNFIEALNQVIEKYHIDYIFPAHDSVVLKLARNKMNIKAEVLTSAPLTCEICRSKKKTYEFFSGASFVPKLYDNAAEVNDFPVFLKPDVGQGAKGVALAKNKQELNYYLEKNRDLLILEYLPGREYTIDCFTDRYNELKFVGTRERRRIKSGISVNSISMKNNEKILEMAKEINEKLNFQGMWFFQVKEDANGDLKLMEISPRIAGTMSLYRNKGINFPLLCLYDRLGYDVQVIENEFEIEVDRALVNRFSANITYKRVYIDFDDTITVKGKVNPFTMMFLYQCLANEKELVLITKHEGEVYETLKTLRIDPNIFEKIIHIPKDDEKYRYIVNDVPAIFIDDSFAERCKIKNHVGIPVFDIDSLECLIDWRY